MKFPFRADGCLPLIYLLAAAHIVDIRGDAYSNTSSTVETEMSATFDDFQVDDAVITSTASAIILSEPNEYSKSVMSQPEIEIARNRILIPSNIDEMLADIHPAASVLLKTATEMTDLMTNDEYEKFASNELKLAYEINLRELTDLRKQVAALKESLSLSMMTPEVCVPPTESLKEKISTCQAKLINGQLLSDLMMENFKLETELHQKKYDAHIFDLTSKLDFCTPKEKLNTNNILQNKEEKIIEMVKERNPFLTLISFFVLKYMEFLSAIPVFYVINKCGHFAFDFSRSVRIYSLQILERCKHLYVVTCLPYFKSHIQPSMKILYDTYIIPIYSEVLHRANTVRVTLPSFVYNVSISGQVYYSDNMLPEIKNLYMIYIRRNWDNIIIPHCHALKKNYLETILPQIEVSYKIYIKANWKKYIILPCKVYIEPYLIPILGQCHLLYVTYFHDKVKYYFEPIYDVILNKWSRMAYDMYRFYGRDNFYGKLVEDIKDLYFFATEAYKSFVTCIQSSRIGKFFFGKYTREGATLIFCTVIFIILVVLWRIVLGILALCLFLVMTPLLPVVYIYSKIRKCFARKAGGIKPQGKRTEAKGRSDSHLDLSTTKDLTSKLPLPGGNRRRASIQSSGSLCTPKITVSSRKLNKSSRFQETGMKHPKQLQSSTDEIPRPTMRHDDNA